MHASAKYLHKLVQNVEGIPKFKIISEVLYDCDTCMKAKSTRAPHTAMRVRGIRVLEIVNSDMAGPLEPARTGERFFVVIIDDYSLYGFAYAIHRKDQITSVFDDFINKMKARFPGQRIAIL